MKRFIETIKVVDGQFQALDWHIRRIVQTVMSLGASIDLGQTFSDIPDFCTNGVFKCRIVYDTEIREIDYSPYSKRCVKSLKLVNDDRLDYAFKYEDRSQLDAVRLMRGYCDDVLVVQNGFLTDTSYTNIVLENNEGLFVPDTYLLNGTMRQRLIAGQIVCERPIRAEDLKNYERLILINAMLGLEDDVSLPISQIFSDRSI